MTKTIIHKFEEAGLGKAPFRLVRVEIRRYKAAPDAPSQPGAACNYCGTGIVETCIIRDANGKQFHVGNECVKKTGDLGLVDVVKREVNRLRREGQAVKDKERIAAGRERLTNDADVRAALASLPHPNEWYAKNGHTLLSYVEYLMQNGGTSGRVRACRIIDKAA